MLWPVPAPWPELRHTVTTEHPLVWKELSRETGHQRQALAPTPRPLQQKAAQGGGGTCVGGHGWRPGAQGSEKSPPAPPPWQEKTLPREFPCPVLTAPRQET